MYRTKEYQERQWDEIKREVDLTSSAYPKTRRIFLADGDALNLPTDKLINTINYLYSSFSNLERVACYAMPKNLLEKSDSDLDRLRDAGLGMMYLGIETGNDVLLKKITKGATSKRILQACKKAKAHKFVLSCMVILGIGGSKYTKQHIDDTAKLVSIVSPDYLATLNLQLETGIYDEFMRKFGEHYIPVSDHEVLDEIERLVSQTTSQSSIVFRANHASNVYSLGGTLPDDRNKLLSLIEELKRHPELLKPKVLRRF
jgi:radical SAM superfamily enzyme YgiQ (UPF0313 family)